MSLPSKMDFYKNGAFIGSSFCNIGHVITPTSLVYCIINVVLYSKELWNECDYITMYGYKFEKDFILGCKNKRHLIECINELGEEYFLIDKKNNAELV